MPPCPVDIIPGVATTCAPEIDSDAALMRSLVPDDIKPPSSSAVIPPISIPEAMMDDIPSIDTTEDRSHAPSDAQANPAVNPMLELYWTTPSDTVADDPESETVIPDDC